MKAFNPGADFYVVLIYMLASSTVNGLGIPWVRVPGLIPPPAASTSTTSTTTPDPTTTPEPLPACPANPDMGCTETSAAQCNAATNICDISGGAVSLEMCYMTDCADKQAGVPVCKCLSS